MTERMPTAVVLGAGTWGIVLAKVLHDNGCEVRAWDFYPAVIESLRETRTTPRLPDFKVPEGILLTPDLAEAVRGAEVAVIVVPSMAVRSTCESIRDAGLADAIRTWVICSKGIESETLLPLHSVVVETFGNGAEDKVGVLSGPSHAEEVGRGLPTSIVACSTNRDLALEIQRLFFQPRFRVYTHDDILGVELAGAIKNVIAIAAGIADGMGFGDNTRAALITRGLAEIVRLGEAMGARRETFMGLSGIGDLIVTASSPHSRNHQFGEFLAQGKSCPEALEAVGMVVEGHAAAKSAHALAKKFNVELPIIEGIYQTIYKGVPAREGLEALLSREAKPEQD